MPASPLALCESLWNFCKCVIQDGDQIDRMAPFVGFFHALPLREGREQAGEGYFCCVPPGPIERLQRFIGEIQDMPPVQVTMVRSGGTQHIRDGHWRLPGADCRGQTTFGAFGITHLDKLTEPAFESWQVG